jgi:hypothetical protein
MKNVSKSLIIVLVLMCSVVFLNGCATHETEGEGHSLLPFGIKFEIGGALSEGPHERVIAIGSKSVEKTSEKQSTFNDSWKETGKSKYENQHKSRNKVVSSNDRGQYRN